MFSCIKTVYVKLHLIVIVLAGNKATWSVNAPSAVGHHEHNIHDVM